MRGSMQLLTERYEEVEEGALKSMAAAGLMGLAALKGQASTNNTTHAEPQQTTQQASAPVGIKNTHGVSIEFPIKVSGKTHSMGPQWDEQNVTINSVGSIVGQVPFSALKVGMVVLFKTGWSSMYHVPGVSDSTPKYLFHRIVRIDSMGHLITKGDNNEREDRGCITPNNILGVCIGVYSDPNHTNPNLKLVLPTVFNTNPDLS